MAESALLRLATLLSAEDRSPEAEYLRRHRMTVESESGPRDEPLATLGCKLGLNEIELAVVALAATVETDLMCGRAIAHLQSPLGGSRPTLGLLAAAFKDLGSAAEIISAIFAGRAAQSGLLRIGGPEGTPLAERTLSVPVPICLALNSEGSDGPSRAWPGAVTGGKSGDVPLPPSVLCEVKRHAAGLSAGVQRALVVRAGSPSEAKAVAAEVARCIGLDALFIDSEKYPDSETLGGLGPWVMLRRLLPVFCFELAPGECRALPTIPAYSGFEIAVCGPDGSVEFEGDAVPSWTIPIPPKGERVRLWELALGQRQLARSLANDRHGSWRIAQLGRLARHQCAIDGRSRPSPDDVAAGAWTAEGGGLEGMAQPIPDLIPDDALVMTPDLRDGLNRLLVRCRGREDLIEGLGVSASAKYAPGVRALFTGPSGTGKTLAASWLATRLGLPLYRVDLAAVTSKYIGETEKNLARLLARAETGGVILLFDEADSMFGKRTELKDSNDRFANGQTNYLLQRIERYDGIVFLTSNSRARFDPAFFRRLDAIVEFPVPGPLERRALWQSHLGTTHLLTQRELNQLSAAADLLGGNIRNAVLAAAVVARSQSRSIDFNDILHSVADEYRKIGRHIPSDLQRNN